MFLSAAEKRHYAAQVETARMYAEGQGVQRDLGKSLEWYRKAIFGHEHIEEICKLPAMAAYVSVASEYYGNSPINNSVDCFKEIV